MTRAVSDKPCTGCGAVVRTRAAAPVCGVCAPRRPVSDAASNRVAAYCDECGRVHAGRWECVERSERSAEEVRLWLMERGEL